METTKTTETLRQSAARFAGACCKAELGDRYAATLARVTFNLSTLHPNEAYASCEKVAAEELAARRRKLLGDTRDLVADLAILEAFHAERTIRYGDMARYRREREMRKLARRIADIDRASLDSYVLGRANTTRDELAAAWKRIAEPKIRRLERETYRHRTRETLATIDAWRATRRGLFPQPQGAGRADGYGGELMEGGY